MRKNCVLVALLSLTVSAGACVGTSKSANPLSPAIAGPIEGVGIIAPTVVEPAIDALVNTMTQPITLKVGNAVTSGVRPLTYRFEIATDPGFTNMVVAQANVPQGAGCHELDPARGPRTRKKILLARARRGWGEHLALRRPERVQRVHAGGLWDPDAAFAPINDATTDTSQPRLLMANAPHSGPVGRSTICSKSAIVRLRICLPDRRVQVSGNAEPNRIDGPVWLCQRASISGGRGPRTWRQYRSVLRHSVVPDARRSTGGGGGGGGRGGGGGGGVLNGTMIQR